jgi:aconitate hydratase 2/2-methylisocitrate dehydratase
MPLDMPESVLVRFKGEMQPGITLRDLVNAIPYAGNSKRITYLLQKKVRKMFSLEDVLKLKVFLI